MRGKISKEKYVEERKNYRKCDNERKRKEEREEKVKLIKTEEEAYRYIHKFRKRREKIDESIDMESWSKHFRELLGGTKDRIVLEEIENANKEERGRKKK